MKVTIIGSGVLGTSLGHPAPAGGLPDRRPSAGATCATPSSPPTRSARARSSATPAWRPWARTSSSWPCRTGRSPRSRSRSPPAAPSGGAPWWPTWPAGYPARVLAGVAAAGAHRGSMHPLQTFADVDTALRMLRETFFFLEGDAEAVEVLRSLVIATGRPPRDPRERARRRSITRARAPPRTSS